MPLLRQRILPAGLIMILYKSCSVMALHQSSEKLSITGRLLAGFADSDTAKRIPGSAPLPAHPRLRVLEKDVERIRNYIKTDNTAAGYYAIILKHGEGILRSPPAQRPPPGPSGILTTVRLVLERVYTTGLLYRLSQPNNQTWFKRGWEELEAAAVNFSDWNPDHFLDVAEMTHAIAIGYDWFYDELDESQRATLALSLEEKGFQPAIKAYNDKAFWSTYPDNWNNVCNGGLIVGYLAVADSPYCPSAPSVYENAIKDIPTAMASYSPKGAWPEGIGYWAYATRYTVYAVTSLMTALGSDQGLSETPGFNTTAQFVLHGTAPSLGFFNYDDSGRYTDRTGATDTPSLFYLATRFNIPAAAYVQRLKLAQTGAAETHDLIHYTPMGTADDVMDLPICAWFTHQNVAMARSSWLDPKASWLGIKAGTTHKGDPHGHLDVGSFVFETNGHRWAIDLGADSYALPEYFGKKRFTYYRLRNIGHNTLTFDDDNQSEEANANLAAAVNCPPPRSGSHSYMSIDSDLTSAYTPSKVSAVYRLFSLNYASRELKTFDRIGYGNSSAKTVTWAMHTFANITITDTTSSARLNYGSDAMQVGIVRRPDETDCPGTSVSFQSIDLQPPQESSKGVNKLMIQAPAKTCRKLTVSIKPAE